MNKSILVIDDEKNIRMTLEKSLGNAGYEVESAINGENALDKLEEDEYPVILLDMNLPGINGIEVLGKINELNYNTRVIMITGYGNVETAVEAMKLGAVDYLRKPFKPDEIKELVEEVFKRYELDSEEYEAESFSEFVNMAKGEINKHNYDRAVELLKKATSIDPEKPEPFNLLGIIYEMRNNQPEAMKMYRTALSLDPTYTPANENLDRAGDMASSKNLNEMNMGDEDK